MKNYKFLVPIVLVALFFGSIYMLYDMKANELNKFNTTLAAARDSREKDIQIDAENYYKDALTQKPSMELYLEIGDFFLETKQMKKAVELGTTITTEYPKDAKGYEFLLGIYEQQQDYIACFDVIETVNKRKLHSDIVSAVTERIQYTFFFNGEYQDVGVYSGGFCPVQIEGKWGYVNQVGDKKIGTRYQYTGPFSGGLAPIIDAEGATYFIDESGNKKHVLLGVETVAKLGLIENELFSMSDGSKWNFYNANHELVFGGFDDASAIGNGIAAVKNGQSWTIVDRNGTDLTGKTYTSVIMDEKLVVSRNGRLFISNGSGYQMISTTGEIVGSTTYEDARLFLDNTYAAVKLNGKWGFVDDQGNMVIEPQFEDARSFSNGFAAVKKDGLWGFITKTGAVAIEPQFEDAKDFNSNGCAFIFVDNAWMLLRLYKSNH